MAIYIKESGRMIKLTDMESIFMLKQEPNTKDTGKMICSMDQVQKYMQMAINIKECLNKEKEMGRVLII
jgi:tRNA A37 threonylcarbamoyladenosine synthetase subunit TsaC/SUA5/YrdC